MRLVIGVADMWLEAGGQALFSTCGKVRKITFSEEKDSGKSKGVATVEFAERLPQPPPALLPPSSSTPPPPPPAPSCRPPAAPPPHCRSVETRGGCGGASSRRKIKYALYETAIEELAEYARYW